ncbi:Putative peptidoglycan binding domain-containing protein [Tissierella praeacuta DSM 18095]|uniref:Putative peptidoglycan binding domain-containing protein n=1 Tax=Tissierella praeacuta DSM 18095 TaxID=1123404 RepID=A0A1M4UEH7_9FIRM|nr:L,D-transpeptidase family protein [Tissierella praeacuta]TCU77197.1 putative peptidoglycan binding protein [Tissierella praeacuta]SHE55162.1 Putative peptidoglycan binding domain-containing protein [Tissierella praeacuta DSM 18095]SUP03938.1 Putative L,D-transpeptidase YkuD [Tissierella praeacuta]
MGLNSYILMFMILPPIMLGDPVNGDMNNGEINIIESIVFQDESEEKADSIQGLIEGLKEGSKDEVIIKKQEEVEEDIQEERQEEIDKEIKEILPEEVQEEQKAEIIKFDINGLMLREGISSDEVLKLKSFLKKKGYTDIVDGYYFDNKTKNIVARYQKENGLQSDGIVGKNTYQKINEDMELNKISISEIEVEFTSEISIGDFIIINKSSNTLYHIREKKIVKKYPVATGKLPEYTPEGKFTIVTKYVNPAWGGAGKHKPIKGGEPNNPLGKRWMGLSIRGGGSYGIHGNSNKNSIGKYISLGCVRMYNEDVEALYNLIDKGTPVWIGNETKLREYGAIFKINY